VKLAIVARAPANLSRSGRMIATWGSLGLMNSQGTSKGKGSGVRDRLDMIVPGKVGVGMLRREILLLTFWSYRQSTRGAAGICYSFSDNRLSLSRWSSVELFWTTERTTERVCGENFDCYYPSSSARGIRGRMISTLSPPPPTFVAQILPP
jgi:hypothetical protein